MQKNLGKDDQMGRKLMMLIPPKIACRQLTRLVSSFFVIFSLSTSLTFGQQGDPTFNGLASNLLCVHKTLTFCQQEYCVESPFPKVQKGALFLPLQILFQLKKRLVHVGLSGLDWDWNSQSILDANSTPFEITFVSAPAINTTLVIHGKWRNKFFFEGETTLFSQISLLPDQRGSYDFLFSSTVLLPANDEKSIDREIMQGDCTNQVALPQN